MLLALTVIDPHLLPECFRSLALSESAPRPRRASSLRFPSFIFSFSRQGWMEKKPDLIVKSSSIVHRPSSSSLLPRV